MCALRVTISQRHRKELERHLHTAQQVGQVHDVKCLLAILAVTAGRSCEQVALTWRVTPKTVREWVPLLLVYGLQGLQRQKPPGRPPKLTKTQTPELAKLLDERPGQAGVAAAGWRAPMIQPWIYERFGVFDNVFYLAQLLKHLGCSYQKAAFVADHLHEAKRQEWYTNTWPPRLTLETEKHALLLLGDAASCPQGGTLSYTWSRRGHQPMVTTSGKRKGDKVFGLIDDFTGCFWYQGQEGRFNSEASIACLTRVLAQTQPHIRLIQDGAKSHTAAAMQRFFAAHTERVTVCQLPSYAPDDNPIEQRWKNVKKAGTPLHYFPTFKALKDKVEPALLKFAKTPEELLARCSLPTALAKVA